MKWMLLLCFLVSCTDNTGYTNQIPAREETTFAQYFSTRLTNQLLISGSRCQGTESTDSEGVTYFCNRDEWLVVVDYFNSCTPEGCTEIDVRPIIALLVNPRGDRFNTFFEIAPVIPVTRETTAYLESVFLRVDNTGQATVVFR